MHLPPSLMPVGGRTPRPGLSRLALPAVLVALAALHVATSRSTPLLSDEAQYVMHAQQLLAGEAYGAIDYVQNPRSFLAPQVYPPGLPAVLVPVLAVAGVSAVAFAAWMGLLWVGALGLAALLFAGDLDRPRQAVALAAAGLCPLLWELRQDVLAEVPFTLFALGALAAFDRGLGRPAPAWWWSLAAGVLAAATSLTRASGLVLVAVFPLAELARHRRLPSRAALSVLVGGALHVAVLAMLEAGPERAVPASGYGQLVGTNLLDRLGEALAGLPGMLWLYGGFAGGVWANGVVPALGRVLFVLSLVPVAASFVARLRARRGSVEVFAALYLASLLPWSFAWSRYLLPLLALYPFYLVHGLTLLARWRPSLRWLTPATLAALALSYVGAASAYRPDAEGAYLGSAAFRRLQAAVERHVPPEAVLLGSGDTRAVALLVGRPIALTHGAPDDEVWAYADALGARFALVADSGAVKERRLAGLLARHPERAALLFRQGRFELYAIDPSRPAPGPARP